MAPEDATSNGMRVHTRPLPQEQVQQSAATKLAEMLTGSKIYQDYQRAFSEATGLPMASRIGA